MISITITVTDRLTNSGKGKTINYNSHLFKNYREYVYYCTDEVQTLLDNTDTTRYRIEVA